MPLWQLPAHTQREGPSHTAPIPSQENLAQLHLQPPRTGWQPDAACPGATHIVIRVQDPGDVLRQVPVQDGLDVVPHVDCGDGEGKAVTSEGPQSFG